MQRSRCAGLLFALPLLLSVPSFATVIHVPGDYATIQAAIDAAVPGDVVEVACGTYQVPEIIMKSGITLRSATGQASCVTVEPVSGPEPRRLLRCVTDGSAEIVGVTFHDGDDTGGGPVFFEGSPRVTNCRFISNNGHPAPNQNAISDEATMATCSPIGTAAIVFVNSEAVVTNCEFIQNYSAQGAVSVCGSPTFVSCTFSGNASEWTGGAVSGNGGTFLSCRFDLNHAFAGGGAVFITNATFQACEFNNNTSSLSGGAAVVCGTLFRQCTFFRNETSYPFSDIVGGAIRVWGGGCAPTVVEDCTFVGNIASLPRLVHESKTSSSFEAHGSAVYVSSGNTLIVSGAIVNANTGSESVYCEGGATITITCSDIYGNPQGDWTGCIANQLGLNGNISVDPMFCDPQNGDFHLSSLSPCLYADCGVMGAFGQGCFDEKAALFHVKDVGNDQGRQVRLIWQRSLNDAPTADPFVIGYGVYRKREQFAKDTPLPETARGEGVAIPGWDFLGTVPSRGDSLYETVVPTLCDSTVTNGQCLSTFFVSAMTQNPFVYWDSPPHSGYSKDNLAPPTPTGFGVAYNTGDGNQLKWDAVAAGDFAGFNVYRSLPPGRAAAAGELVATTTQTTWTDPDFDGWDVQYEVTSFDVAGNESAPATAGATTPVPDVIPSRFELLPNIPNPFNPSTTIRFITPDEDAVRITIYDARGSLVRVLVDKTLPAGHHDAVWDGRDGKGAPVSSGVYLCRLEQRSDFRTRKIVLIK